jgi:hypothetical protein
MSTVAVPGNKSVKKVLRSASMSLSAAAVVAPPVDTFPLYSTYSKKRSAKSGMN